MLGNTTNQPSKFKTKKWVETHDESWERYNQDNQTRFKTSILRSRLCDYSNTYILFEETITIENKAAAIEANHAANKKVVFKNIAPFINYVSRISNMEVDDGHDIDIVVLIYNLIDYSDKYSQKSGMLL